MYWLLKKSKKELCTLWVLRCRPHPWDFISSSLLSALLPALMLCFLLFVRGTCLWMLAETVSQLTVHSFTSVWSELGEQSRLLPVTQSSVGLHCGSLLWGCEIVPAEEDVRTWTGLTGFLQLLVVITKIFFVCEFNSGELSVVNATLNKRIIKYITDKKRHQTCARDAFSSWWLRAFHELNVASLSFLSELKRLWFTESQSDVFFFHVHLTWPDSLITNTLMRVRHSFMKWSKSSNICY